jgi:hypothetical protein
MIFNKEKGDSSGERNKNTSCPLQYKHSRLLELLSDKTNGIARSTDLMIGMSTNVQNIHETLLGMRADNRIFCKALSDGKKYLYMGLLVLLVGSALTIVTQSSAKNQVRVAATSAMGSLEISPATVASASELQKKTQQ